MIFYLAGSHQIAGMDMDAATGMHSIYFRNVPEMNQFLCDNRAQLAKVQCYTLTTPVVMLHIIEQGTEEIIEKREEWYAKIPPEKVREEPQQTPREFILGAISDRINRATINGKHESASALEELRQYVLRWLHVLAACLFLPQIALSTLSDKARGAQIDRLDTRGNVILHRIDRFRF